MPSYSHLSDPDLNPLDPGDDVAADLGRITAGDLADEPEWVLKKLREAAAEIEWLGRRYEDLALAAEMLLIEIDRLRRTELVGRESEGDPILIDPAMFDGLRRALR